MGVEALSPRARKRVESRKERREGARLCETLHAEGIAENEEDLKELNSYFAGDDEGDDDLVEIILGLEREDILERQIDPRTGGSIRTVEQFEELVARSKRGLGLFTEREQQQYTKMLATVTEIEKKEREFALLVRR